MNPVIQLRQTTSVFLVAFGLTCFGFLLQAQAVSPPPDGCYPNFTTAEGCNTLNFLTSGSGNTGVGWFALYQDTTGGSNTGVGAAALALNNGDFNTAVGTAALLLNTTGTQNVAVGTNALLFNDGGADNNAIGYSALANNATGNFNNAHGREALASNVDGMENEALGDEALLNSQHDSHNTAVGDNALLNQNGGDGNTAVGRNAGDSIVDGSDNIAIGHFAGGSIVHANQVIAIGAVGVSTVFGDASNSCYVGSIYNQNIGGAGVPHAVWVDADGTLGLMPSSRRFKHEIQPMNNASETLYSLKPVTFKYNSDKKGTPQYGLIAEDVAEINPDLILRNDKGEILSVRYEQINSMLLNEFLKEHKKVEQLQATVAQQQKGMELLTAQLKEHAAQIQKVNAQLEVNNPAPRVVTNNP